MVIGYPKTVDCADPDTVLIVAGIKGHVNEAVSRVSGMAFLRVDGKAESVCCRGARVDDMELVGVVLRDARHTG